MPANLFHDLWVAVVGGLLTAIVLHYWTTGRKKTTYFLHQKEINQHQISVNGSWENKLATDDEQSTVSMDLTQTGVTITGHMTIDTIIKRNGLLEPHTFHCAVTGRNEYGFIILQGTPAGKNLHAFNCGIFTFLEGGHVMEGYAIRVHNVTSEVHIDPKITWTKKASSSYSEVV